jgi:hypothetical protein
MLGASEADLLVAGGQLHRAGLSVQQDGLWNQPLAPILLAQ